jgi:hypothetical protein
MGSFSIGEERLGKSAVKPLQFLLQHADLIVCTGKFDFKNIDMSYCSSK